MIRIYCSKADATLQETETLTAGMVNTPVVQFTFSSDWDGLGKSAIVRAGTVIKEVVVSNNQIVVPSECLAKAGVNLIIGVWGGNFTTELPTVWCACGEIQDATNPNSALNHEEGTASNVAQMLAAAERAEAALDQIENANWDDVAQKVGAEKVNKPTSSPNGVAGQILKTNGDGFTQWIDPIVPTDEQVDTSVSNWLDNHPEATTTVQDEAITAKKLNTSLQRALYSKPFLDVTDYGINPDTGEDLYEQIFDFLHEEIGEEGAVVFFPAGRYIISDCIFIPANTTLMGVGEETVIYYNAQYSAMGAGITCGGNNVTIKNMSVEHQGSDYIKTDRGRPYLGGIGHSTFDFSSWTQYHKSPSQMTRSEKHDLFVYDIWSESTYVLQTEPESSCGITNVVYKNIYAPNSLVSIHPHGDDGYIHDVVVDNVICGLLRNGSGNMNAKNVRISNVKCAEALLTDNCTVENLYLDGDLDPEWHWYPSQLVLKDSLVLKNSVIKKGSSTFSSAISSYAQPTTKFLFDNLTVTEYDTVWVNQTTDVGPMTFLNCDFSGQSLLILNGFAVNCNASFANRDAFINLDRRTIGKIDLVPGEKIESGRGIGKLYRFPNTNLVFIQGYFGNATETLGTNDTIFTIPEGYRPSSESIVPGSVITTSAVSAYKITLGTDGTIKQKLTSTAKGAFFAGMYNL